MGPSIKIYEAFYNFVYERPTQNDFDITDCEVILIFW